MKRISSVTCATLLIFFLTMDAWANDAEELARKAQDPLANISAVQFDMSSKFNVGPDNDTAYSGLVQPVYAISTEKINYIFIHNNCNPELQFSIKDSPIYFQKGENMQKNKGLKYKIGMTLIILSFTVPIFGIVVP